MQTASTNNSERMGRSQELSEISSQLNIPWSTVSGIITKWKQLGTTETQPRSGRLHKITEWGQCMVRQTFCSQ